MATIVYFGALPDLLEKGVEKVNLPENVEDVESLLVWLSERGGHWKKLARKGTVRATINRHFVNSRSRVTDRDQVTLLPVGYWREPGERRAGGGKVPAMRSGTSSRST